MGQPGAGQRKPVIGGDDQTAFLLGTYVEESRQLFFQEAADGARHFAEAQKSGMGGVIHQGNPDDGGFVRRKFR